MSERRIRILFFILGLTFGIILGASVVRVYIDKVNAETSVSKNFVSRLFSNIVGLVYKPKSNKSDTVIVVKTLDDKKYSAEKDSTVVDDDNLPESKSSDLSNVDSSIASKNEKNEDNIVVLSDKLVGTIRLQIIESKVVTDSTANKKTNLKGNNNSSVYAVEFWQSPLNYRGYKTQKNKIVLFGINKDESLKLIRLNEKMYLKFQNQFSLIEPHSDFHNFEKISDQQLVSLLNSKL